MKDEAYGHSLIKMPAKQVIDQCDRKINAVLKMQRKEDEESIEDRRQQMEKSRNRWYRRLFRKGGAFVPATAEEAKAALEVEDPFFFPSGLGDYWRKEAARVKSAAERSEDGFVYVTVNDWDAIT